MTSAARKAKSPAKVIAALEASPRPYRNHYAGGMRISACSTAEGAAEAAFSHVLRGHATNAQVVNPRGGDEFRFHWTSFGISVIVPPKTDYHRPKIAKPKLRVVK